MEHWLAILFGAGIAPGAFYGIRAVIRSMLEWRRETRIQEVIDACLMAETEIERSHALQLLHELLSRNHGVPTSSPVERRIETTPNRPSDPPMAT